MEASHFFPQGMLAVITLVGGGLEMEGLGLEPGVRQGFPSAHWSSLLFWGWGQIPSSWGRGPEGWV